MRVWHKDCTNSLLIIITDLDSDRDADATFWNRQLSRIFETIYTERDVQDRPRHASWQAFESEQPVERAGNDTETVTAGKENEESDSSAPHDAIKCA